MAIEEVVRKVLLDEHADVIREAVKAVAGEMMELEVSELVGAARGERRPEDRATHRNGGYPVSSVARRWKSRSDCSLLKPVSWQVAGGPTDGPCAQTSQRPAWLPIMLVR